ncbi:MAG: hypothetical protein ABI833_10695 [Acidobacteriota bacterium]
MYKTTLGIVTALFCITGLATAEPQTTPPPNPSVNIQLNTEFLNDLMRSAAMFNGMVQNLNLNRTLHESGVAPDSTDANGRPVKHAAAVLGAGAGVGLAVGGMTGSQKGAMIGAAVGGASALIIDQILQHQAKERQANADAYRDNHSKHDRGYDNDRGYDHDLRFKEREPQR